MSEPLTEQLMHEQPSLHGEAQLWGLAWAALAYIERAVQPGMATLETGAGASTILFAARGTDHEAVRKAIADTDLDAMSGPLSFNADGTRNTPKFLLLRAENGKFGLAPTTN